LAFLPVAYHSFHISVKTGNLVQNLERASVMFSRAFFFIKKYKRPVAYWNRVFLDVVQFSASIIAPYSSITPSLPPSPPDQPAHYHMPGPSFETRHLYAYRFLYIVTVKGKVVPVFN
jgi:hypothetical protein